MAGQSVIVAGVPMRRSSEPAELVTWQGETVGHGEVPRDCCARDAV